MSLQKATVEYMITEFREFKSSASKARTSCMTGHFCFLGQEQSKVRRKTEGNEIRSRDGEDCIEILFRGGMG
jgi:hypothetical protein